MSRDKLAQELPRLWFRRRLSPHLWPLVPLSWVFRTVVAARRWLYAQDLLNSLKLPVPVIIVGNLTVGGSGKTPLTLWVVEHLRTAGYRPGILSRGYGGEAARIEEVLPESDAAVVGDEPLLLALRSRVPVFVGRDRVAAGSALLERHPYCDVLVADDGLQHYRLARCVELAVFDSRGAGNGRLLPAGPLREPLDRLRTVTGVVCNGGMSDVPEVANEIPCFSMRLSGTRFIALDDPLHTCVAEDLKGKKLYALAGIGDPSRFFSQLASLGLEFSAHPFPDHRRYRAEDLAFARDGVLLMTEKDAVKCRGLTLPETWVLPVDARIEDNSDGASLLNRILEKLNGCASA